MSRGKILSAEEVDSVVDIVASAVQGLDPNRVTVTDQNGRLLNSGSQNSVSARSRKNLKLNKNANKSTAKKLTVFWFQWLVWVITRHKSMSLWDFTNTEQTQRRYNPDLPALRSEMTVEDSSIGGGLGGIPGALSNQPPLESDIPEEAGGANSQTVTPSRKHSESTRNYELDESISYTKQQTGVIRRISVSVALDYINGTSAEGETTQHHVRCKSLPIFDACYKAALGLICNAATH